MKVIELDNAEISSAIAHVAGLQKWLRRSGRKYVNGDIDLPAASDSLRLAGVLMRRVMRGSVEARKVEISDARKAQ